MFDYDCCTTYRYTSSKTRVVIKRVFIVSSAALVRAIYRTENRFYHEFSDSQSSVLSFDPGAVCTFLNSARIRSRYCDVLAGVLVRFYFLQTISCAAFWASSRRIKKRVNRPRTALERSVISLHAHMSYDPESNRVYSNIFQLERGGGGYEIRILNLRLHSERWSRHTHCVRVKYICLQAPMSVNTLQIILSRANVYGYFGFSAWKKVHRLQKLNIRVFSFFSV